MAEFSFTPQSITGLADHQSSLERELKRLADRLSTLSRQIGSQGGSYGSVSNTISAHATAVHNEQTAMKHLHDTLLDISSLYIKADQLITQGKSSTQLEQFIESVQTIMEEFRKTISSIFNIGPVDDYEVSSIVFDEDGTYGGNQGSPKSITDPELKDELYATVRSYYSDMTDAEVSAYLKKVNSEGCGYVAIINTIFSNYDGRSADFEKAFGFSMYDANGDLNYNKLLVDFYSSTDNHASEGGSDAIDPYRDYDKDVDGPKSDYTMYGDTVGAGTSQYEREYQAEMYLLEHGIDGNIKTDQNITVHNFEQKSENGNQVIIAFRNGNLYNMDGTLCQQINGGHAMVVTGVTDDGHMIVSSWGQKYYIDPDEVVTITHSDGSTDTTSMTFSTISYQ